MTRVLPAYPNVALTTFAVPSELVVLLQRRLSECGVGPLAETGGYDQATVAAVRRFQARFPDSHGDPLVVDGIVGPITWDALRVPTTPDTAAVPVANLPTDALEFALAEVGTREQPRGSNRGPRVDEYIRAVGLDPADAHPWCAAFLYWCFEQAAQRAGRANPVPKSASVLEQWKRSTKTAPVVRIATADAVLNPALVRPGTVFVMDFGGGVGHTGLVINTAAGRLSTVEGNTNDGGSREGIGVFRREGRKIASIQTGFLDYSAC
jgi:peptidoglycan hydrolase-like protein with peptidoglycan-binding domain